MAHTDANAPSRVGDPDQPAANPIASGGRGHVTPTPIGHANAPVLASWRGIDGTPAPVHAHMVQW